MSETQDLEARLAAHFGVAMVVAFAQAPLSPSRLAPGESVRYAQLPSGARRESWLLGRAALRRVLRRLRMRPDSSRLRFPHPRIALTHCGNVAIAVATEMRVAGIGIDYECSRRPLRGAAHLFLDAPEMRWLRRRSRPVGARTLLRLWTVKEAVYKATPENRRTFLKDYSIEHPGRARGHVVFAKGRRRIAYWSARRGNGVLTVALCPPRREEPRS